MRLKKTTQEQNEIYFIAILERLLYVKCFKRECLFHKLTTDDTTLENGIFDLKHPEYNQKDFSWIYSDSANEAVQNGNKSLM